MYDTVYGWFYSIFFQENIANLVIMVIVELVGYLKCKEKTERLIGQLLPNVEMGLVVIFMKDFVSLDADISFFDDDAIPPDIIIEVDGVKYEAFFSLKEAQDMVESYETEYHHKLSNLDIAKRMLGYHLKDA